MRSLVEKFTSYLLFNNLDQGKKFEKMRLCGDFSAGPSKEQPMVSCLEVRSNKDVHGYGTRNKVDIRLPIITRSWEKQRLPCYKGLTLCLQVLEVPPLYMLIDDKHVLKNPAVFSI